MHVYTCEYTYIDTSVSHSLVTCSKPNGDKFLATQRHISTTASSSRTSRFEAYDLCVQAVDVAT